MVGETDYFIISRWISPHGRSKFSTIGWQSNCNFNPPAISQWTRKCPRNVVDSSCELPDFSRKKYSNTSQYLGNGNRYPSGHEHGYQADIEGCRFAPPNFQLKNSKDPPFDAHQQINRGHQNFWDDPILWEIFYAGEASTTNNFQVSPLAKLQAFTFGRLGVVSPTVFVIVLCLGFALGLGFCSGVEVQNFVENWVGLGIGDSV
jgi:hypothetical protein